MTPEQEAEAIAELAKVFAPGYVGDEGLIAAHIWKNRATIHHILTKWGRVS